MHWKGLETQGMVPTGGLLTWVAPKNYLVAWVVGPQGPHCNSGLEMMHFRLLGPERVYLRMDLLG